MAQSKDTGAKPTDKPKSAVPARQAPVAKPAVAKAKSVSKTRLKASAAKAAIAKPPVNKTAKVVEAKAPVPVVEATAPVKASQPVATAPVAPVAAPVETPAVADKVETVAETVVEKTVAAAPEHADAATQPAQKTIKITQEFLKMNTPEAVTKGFQDTMADMTAKSKAAYEKSTALLADASEFTKGNVEAMVESGKILAAGMQEMSRSFVADSKAEFEALTAEVKELAAVKSPTDFFQLQSAMMRKYFDKSVAAASKNTEAMLKLANDAAQPLSSRVSLAMEKMKAA